MRADEAYGLYLNILNDDPLVKVLDGLRPENNAERESYPVCDRTVSTEVPPHTRQQDSRSVS